MTEKMPCIECYGSSPDDAKPGCPLCHGTGSVQYVNRHPRDKATGRFRHEWGVIGEPSDADNRQTDECQVCGMVRVTGSGETYAVFYKDREAARKRGGVTLLEGY